MTTTVVCVLHTVPHVAVQMISIVWTRMLIMMEAIVLTGAILACSTEMPPITVNVVDVSLII